MEITKSMPSDHMRHPHFQYDSWFRFDFNKVVSSNSKYIAENSRGKEML